MLSALAQEFQISVITSAYDKSPEPMNGVTPDQWCDVLGAHVWYASEPRPNPLRLLHLIRSRNPQLVYLNSLWNGRFSILPLLALRASGVPVPVLIAPRGELSAGALRIRPWRKRLVVLLYRALGISRAVTWHASTEMERADIRRTFGARTACHVAVDLREGLPSVPHSVANDRKEDEGVRAVFLSRIAPKKNLDGLLRALSLVSVPIELTIAGPIDDRTHWATCEELITALPQHIAVRVHGPVPPSAVVEFLSAFDLFLLPTHGENYGHAVLEALAAGLPAIVGRETPWRRVEEEKAGWLVNSRSPADLARLIERFAGLTPGQHQAMSQAASRLARAVQSDGGGVDAHRRMFVALTQPSRSSIAVPAPADRHTSTSSSTRLRVKLVTRRPLPGQFSVERVFADIAGAMPVDIDASLVEVPFLSQGVIPRLGNMLFTARLRADVVHITGDIQYCALAARRSRCVLTVLDLVSLRRLTGWRRHVLSLIWYNLPARHARVITTISNKTRDELLAQFPSVARKLDVIACPVGQEFRPAPAGSSDPGRFRILQVGTGPNKNLERAATALDGLPVHLHIIGHLGDEQERLLKELGLSFTHDADLADKEVLAAYQQSHALVFTSTYEGFGLPILEAQACGVPVVTSDISPMRETAGGAAILVDPYDTESIRRGIESAISNTELRRNLIQSGRENAARYSPASIAAEYATIYQEMESHSCGGAKSPRQFGGNGWTMNRSSNRARQA